MRLQETAINIGYACSLLNDKLVQYRIIADTKELNDIESKGKNY